MLRKRLIPLLASAAATALALSACAGEGTGAVNTPAPANTLPGEWSADVLNIDYATYNPLSLIVKDQGWLEAATAGKVTINWIKSAGSSKANEALRSGA